MLVTQLPDELAARGVFGGDVIVAVDDPNISRRTDVDSVRLSGKLPLAPAIDEIAVLICPSD
jgi:hypothetical protein